MDTAETCFICGKRSQVANDLVTWFVESGRRTVHTACWIATYLAGRIERI